MGKCPACERYTDELVAEIVVLHFGSLEKRGIAYRCSDDECAAFIAVQLDE